MPHGEYKSYREEILEELGPEEDPFLPFAPLFYAAVLFAAGVFLAQIFYLRPGGLLAAVLLLAAVSLWSAIRVPRLGWLPLCLLWIGLGLWTSETAVQPTPSQPVRALQDGLLRTVEGTVVSAEPPAAETDGSSGQQAGSEAQGGASQTFDLRLTRAEQIRDDSDTMVAVPDGAANQIRVTALWSGATPAPVRCGDRLRVLLLLHPVPVYHDPGVWSREQYLESQHVSASATVSAALAGHRLEVVQRGGWSAACLLNRWRQNAAMRILQLPAAMKALPHPLRLSAEDAAMLTALLAGDRRLLDRPLRNGFERTGTFHLVVVSGLHLAIMAGLLLPLLERVLPSRLFATLATIAVTGLFAAYTGFAIPVQRSFWMILLYLLARLLYRDRLSLNLIGFAALCLMAAQPAAILNASLQMTLLAVLAAAAVAAPLFEIGLQPFLMATRKVPDKTVDMYQSPAAIQFRQQLRWLAEQMHPLLPRSVGERVIGGGMHLVLRLLEVAWMSLVVELALALPMAMYFHRFTLYALPVNLIILPLLTILLPLALILLVALMLWQPLALVPAAVCAVLLHGAQAAVGYFAAQRWANLRLPAPAAWQAIAVALLILVATWLAVHASAHWRQWTLPLLLLILPILLLPQHTDIRGGELFFQALDVGQGDSLLVVTPGGHSVLIDGGGLLQFGHGSSGSQLSKAGFEVGEDVVSPVLWAHGIRRLDVVVLTHAHTDHLGGLAAVVRNFRPRELWVANNPRTPAYQALLDAAVQSGTTLRSLHADEMRQIDAVNFRVLAPAADYSPGSQPANDDSLVLHAQFGATSILLAGDAEAPEENGMLAQGDLRSTILKVGHHGSRTSTQPSFLSAVSPRWAVISCGLHNHFGHPRPEVLEELQQAHVQTFRTDLDGTTCFALDGRQVTAMPMCSPLYGFRARP